MLALGLVGGCGNKKEEKKEEKDLARISQKQDKIEVKAAKVRLAPFEMELVSNGKVNARRKAVLAFITNDVVRKVHVKNGERVKKGDPIVSVDELKAGQKFLFRRLIAFLRRFRQLIFRVFRRDFVHFFFPVFMLSAP